jgi:hypothetical protein
MEFVEEIKKSIELAGHKQPPDLLFTDFGWLVCSKSIGMIETPILARFKSTA